MFTPERRNAIKKIVHQHNRMHFDELRRLIDVSPATLRRDLAELEESGDVIRVHGGVMDPSYVRTEVSFDERATRNHAAKKAIAAAAVRMVPPGATVLVDAGTTCLEIGRLLLPRKDVRIITHSVTLLHAASQGEAAVWCLGGELRRVSGALIGSRALTALNGIHADVGFIGVSGLDLEQGCSTTELFEAEMKQALIAHSGRTILVADHTKWEKPSTIRFAAWGHFNDWITDKLPDPKKVNQLRAAGVKIHKA